MEWERITARDHGLTGRERLVYWRRKLADGTWLSVKHESKTAAFGWTWKHHIAPGTDYCATGVAMSSVTARRLADEHIEGVMRCPNDRTLLEDHGDATYCPKCGDEWEAVEPCRRPEFAPR